MPNDTNPLQNLMGGNLLKWMDIASSVASGKHAEARVVTAAVDNVSFKKPIRLGEVVTISARVTRAFNTSMEIFIEVWSQNVISGEKVKANEAFYTFVALDESGKPKEVPEIVPETDAERRLFDGALRRRELRLILAGRMKPGESAELKSLFK